MLKPKDILNPSKPKNPRNPRTGIKELTERTYRKNLQKELRNLQQLTTTYRTGTNLTATYRTGTNLLTATYSSNLQDRHELSLSNAGYPDAFGWISGDFQSIMSISALTTDRVLNYSAPSVFVDGVSTGVLGAANNARIIDQLSPAVALFRIDPDVMFENGFE